MAVHGDIIEVSSNHPTLGSRLFNPKANESGTLDPGGFRNADDANMITSAGSLIQQKVRVVGSLEVVCEHDPNRGDIEYLVQMQKSPELASWTIALNSGVVYKGEGFPVGDIQYDTQAGTFTLKVVSSTFEKI
jgi:hypothetical protein